MKPTDGPVQNDVSPDDPRVTRALEEYLALVEAGQKPDREAFLARDREIAGALAECLDGLDFLRMTAPKLNSPVAEPPPEPFARQPLGDYHIIREVGRGGMGIVYEAKQLSLGRRVALKVLPFAATLDAKQLQRFKNEAQAAAHLHHPHIVPVYAFGCERGVHYYAMQFIDGQTLAGLIDGLRGGPAEDSADAATRSLHGQLPLREERPAAPTVPMARATTVQTAGLAHWRTAARFGAQAAEALEHAHQLGVIHRDVKPANLLIDEQRHLWVTDFGLARCANDAGMTMTGDLLGTLRYMSPEQASARRGLVDHRTDVYSLGATLYELLTLQPVFDGAERAELLRQILHEDPVAPRRIRPDIPADLETIVLKALEKNVTERYATAQELADDLRRFIEDRPIQARRPGVVDRLGKWSRRHRPLVASAVALLLLAVVGLAVSTFLIGQEQARTRAAYEMEAQARAREADAREREAESRTRAENNFQQARRAVDYLTQVAVEDMADDPKMQPFRRKLLEAALEYYKDFIKQQPDDPKTQEELAASHYRVAKILSEMGRQEEVIASLEQSRKLLCDLAVKYPTVPEYPAGVVIIDHDLSVAQEGVAVRLLKLKQVQDDLRLTESQVKQINQLADQRQNVYRNTANVAPQALRQTADEVQALEKSLNEMLQAEQQRRLQQLLLQQRGTRALLESPVAEMLKLTTEQLERIGNLQGELRRAGSRNVANARADGKDIRDRAAGVLTPEQKAKWKELTGEPFQGQLLPGGIFIGNSVLNGVGGSITINGVNINTGQRSVPPVKKD